MLSYGGGVAGQGVMSGAKTKVYLVFYGNQWGTQGTDANGNAKFSGDAAGAAGAAQQMFKGIGTNNERWSADLTQWCDGAGVATGAYSCPTNLPASQFVPYQSGGTLAGVWYDNAGAEPTNVDGHGLALEANKAAGHFGNTNAAANRNAYYIIMSPHGTDPDGYQNPTTGYCAWHDWNNDAANLTGGAAPSSYGNDIAFSNQPYNVDMGQSCGTNFVTAGSAGTLDGYTMTLGHEWHEMMSDTYPNTAWSNPGTNGGTQGYENSDECAWIAPGQAGGAARVNFGSYGSYAEQASWSNDTNSCAISHPIVNHSTNLNGTHMLGVSGTGVVLDDPASSTTAGQQLITWAKNGNTNQRWVFTQQSDGSYTIVNGASKLCMDDAAWSNTAGSKVIQFTCTGGANQHWKVAQLSSGAYSISNAASGLLLGTASTSNGALVTQQANNNSSLQHWTIG
jgi:hypothetical protein